jgi:cell division protein ZipA
MEADILRLILFLIGAALILGIYLADRYKKREPSDSPQDWMSSNQEQPMADHIEPSWDSLYQQDAEPDPEPAGEEAEPDAGQDQSPAPEKVVVDVEEKISSELEQLEEILHDEPGHGPRDTEALDEDTPKEQMSISFFTSDSKKQKPVEQEQPLPVKIIQLAIVPHDGEFYGDDILCVVQEVGLELGEMDVFHHYGDDPEKRQAVYSMASMVEPGTFPVGDMDGFSTPGLALFATLPGPKDGLTTFTDMLYAAERLADLLDGELRDDTHSALSKQTISHMREEIQEYHRRLQLARSQQ